MGRASRIGAICLAALPSGSHAEGEIEAQVTSAIRAIGCVVSQEGLQYGLTAMGLTREEAKPVIQAMVADGRLVPDDQPPELGGLLLGLDPELCTAGTPRERLIEKAQVRDCMIDPATLELMLGHTLPEDGNVEAVVHELVANGEATVDARGLTLAPSLCPSSGGN